MLLSLGFGLIFAATYSLCQISDAIALETGRFEITDFVKETRSRRSLFGIGNGVWVGYKAAKELLKDAWPVMSNFANRKAYVKPGNYEKAVADFRSVNPTNVHTFELPGGIKGLRGVVGDRRVLVRNHPDTDGGTVEIYKGLSTPRERALEIKYIQKSPPKS